MSDITFEGIPSTVEFEHIRIALEDREFAAKMVKDTGVLVVFNISDDKGEKTAHYVLDLKKEGTIKIGEDESADCIFSMKETPWADLVAKKTSPKWLLFTGKAKHTGSIITARLVEPALRKVQDHYKKITAGK